MKHECAVVKDLLPLYREKLVSEESAGFIKEHLATCADCRKAYASLAGESVPSEQEAEENRRRAVPVKRMKRKLRARRFLSVVLSVFLTLCVLAAVWWFFPQHRAQSVYFGESTYSKIELRHGVRMIEHDLSPSLSREDGVIYAIEYAGDAYSQSRLAYCNELGLARDGTVYTECMVFQTSFNTGNFVGMSMDKYTSLTWSFTLAKTETGIWEIVTAGV